MIDYSYFGLQNVVSIKHFPRQIYWQRWKIFCFLAQFSMFLEISMRLIIRYLFIYVHNITTETFDIFSFVAFCAASLQPVNSIVRSPLEVSSNELSLRWRHLWT
jgi:hypothetical protein